MDIIIKETSEKANLSIIDPASGVDWISDFVGNTGALLNDEQFEWDEDLNAYICDKDTFEWWSAVVEDNQELYNRMADLSEQHGGDAVKEAARGADDVDLEYAASAIGSALDAVFGDGQ